MRACCAILMAVMLGACSSRPSSPVPRPASAPAPATPIIDTRVVFERLNSPELSGSSARTAEYLADQFAHIGLRAASGQSGYVQQSSVQQTVVSPETNLLLNDRSLAMNTDFVPAPTTGAGAFHGQVIFVGYGVASSDRNHNDYADIDAGGKIVLALQQATAAQVDTQVKAAAHYGALAVLFVLPVGRDDIDSLPPFVATESGPLPVIQITRRVADLLLTTSQSPDLGTVRQAIDSSGLPHSFLLQDVEISGDVGLRQMSVRYRVVAGVLPAAGAYSNERVLVSARVDQNATTIAALLRAVEKLKSDPPLPRSVVIAISVLDNGAPPGVMLPSSFSPAAMLDLSNTRSNASDPAEWIRQRITDLANNPTAAYHSASSKEKN